MKDLDGRLVVAGLVAIIVTLVVLYCCDVLTLSWLVSGGAIAAAAAFSAYQIFGPDDKVLHFGPAPAKQGSWSNPSWPNPQWPPSAQALAANHPHSI